MSYAQVGEEKTIGKALTRVDALSHLPNNWNSYGAVAPNLKCIYNATKVLRAAFQISLKPHRIDASAEDGIVIAFLNDLSYADIECFNSGEIIAVKHAFEGEIDTWRVSDLEILQALESIWRFMR